MRQKKKTSWKQLDLFTRFFKPSKRSSVRSPLTLPASDAQLQGIWLSLIENYFPDRNDLADYAVVWSVRSQLRTLASCNISARKVIVARELNHPSHLRWLNPLLYHEMCHAVLGENVPKRNGKRRWHGKEFKVLERQHAGIELLDEWIKQGGWSRAVRSDRSRRAHRQRKRSND